MKTLYFSREKFLKSNSYNLEDYCRNENTKYWVDQCDRRKVLKDGESNIVWIMWDGLPIRIYIHENWCEEEEQ